MHEVRAEEVTDRVAREAPSASGEIARRSTQRPTEEPYTQTECRFESGRLHRRSCSTERLRHARESNPKGTSPNR